MRQTHEHQHKFVWKRIKTPEDLGKVRLAAMKKFLTDFDGGKLAGRYVSGELPDLPFGANAFDLAVCSHFLFLYSDILSLEFHQRAIEEMCRVAQEARIFPLLELQRETFAFCRTAVESAGGCGVQHIHRSRSLRVSARWKPDAPESGERPTHEQMMRVAVIALTAAWILPLRSESAPAYVDMTWMSIANMYYEIGSLKILTDGYISGFRRASSMVVEAGWPKPTIRLSRMLPLSLV